MGWFICKEYTRFLSSRELKLCYSSHTMLEINRGIPEGVTQKAGIIDFEAAKGKRLEEKNRHANWLQERGQQPVKPVDANSPAFPQVYSERGQKPYSEKNLEITPVETHTGQIQPPAEIKNNVINFQAARENRFIKAGEIQESTPFTQTDADQTDYDDDPEEEQINALRLVRSKLAQFDVPTEKRNEIFENLADDPKALSKVAGVVQHFSKPKRDYGAELEESAAFRKRIIDAVQNKQQVDQESVQKLTGFQLTMLLFLSLFTGNIDMFFDELEQEYNKEKAEKNA